jgi:hypothetical protein
MDRDPGSSGDSNETGVGPGDGGMTWPKRVALHATGPLGGDGVRFADGVVVREVGDFYLVQTMVLSLGSPTEASVCEKGRYDVLTEVPTDVATCPASLSGGWGMRIYLSGSAVHTVEESYVIGLSALVRDASHQALYRLRILGDAYDDEGLSTALFEYEPIP